jgi:hypothetical protein
MKRSLRSLGYTAIAAVAGIAGITALATPVRADTIDAELLVNGTAIQTWSGVPNSGTLAVTGFTGSFDGVGYNITLSALGNPPALNPQVLGSNTFDFTTSGSIPAGVNLALLVTDVGLSVPASGFSSADQILALVGSSTATETTYYSSSNTPYGGTAFSSPVTGGAGTTGSSTLAVGSTPGLYSITEEYSGTTSGGPITFQGDMDVTATPLPATLPLLAGGLGLLGLIGRRKKRNNGQNALAGA